MSFLVFSPLPNENWECQRHLGAFVGEGGRGKTHHVYSSSEQPDIRACRQFEIGLKLFLESQARRGKFDLLSLPIRN